MRLAVLSVVSILAASLASSCAGDLTLAGSCGGDHSTTCEPYAYAEVAAATFEPAGLQPGQLAATARVHVQLRQCASMAPQHSVRIVARAVATTGLEDGGADSTFMVAEVSDDGTNGDATAGDGVIDYVLGNPFTAAAPASTALTLTFIPHAGAHCDGASLDVPYTTGPAYVISPTP